jgi:voltage-gated potassium channel
VLFGGVILADFAARLLVAGIGCAISPTSRPGPTLSQSFRSWRRSRESRAAFCGSCERCGCCATIRCWPRLREDSTFFRRNEEVIFAVTNLAVFIFVMTAIVYETQKFRNPQIANYADALYFTVTALTTTGFGDITLSGTTGRLITVVIMIFGVTLFFNLARALLTRHKVRFCLPDLRTAAP